MSTLKSILVGVLLIALVHGQHELDSDIPGNTDPHDKGQEQEGPYLNPVQKRFQAVFNQIQDKLPDYQEQTEDLESEVVGHNSENDEIQDDFFNGNYNDSPISDSADSFQREKRSLRKKLKKVGKKVERAGKKVVDKALPVVIAGGLAGR